ncbi:hypothetical protein HZS_6870 [Henneguya salminicola]|nr:hypothetical protein HZS_6870 [Henneguya salminicola]
MLLPIYDFSTISRELRSTALFSTLAPAHIISETTRILSANISAILPENNTLHSNIQKIRLRENMPHSFPRCASDLIIPNEFINTFRGEPFMVAEVLCESGKRTTIFASRRNLNYLSQFSSIYFDATFKTVTQIFFNIIYRPCDEFRNYCSLRLCLTAAKKR